MLTLFASRATRETPARREAVQPVPSQDSDVRDIAEYLSALETLALVTECGCEDRRPR